MKRIITILSILILVTGCSNSNMQFIDNSIKGEKIYNYQSKLSIYGTYNGENININENINNVNNKDFEITKNNNTYHIINDIKYLNSEIYNKEISYIDTNFIISTIKNGKKFEELEEKVGEITYKTYRYNSKKEDIKKILENTELENVDFKNDIPSKVYIDSEEQIAQIIFYLNKGYNSDETLEINVFYNKYNRQNKIIITRENNSKEEYNDD